MLDAETIHLLRRSFARVEAQPVISALVFYQHLFELSPELRSLFTRNIEDQSRKLIDMLSWSLGMLSNPAGLQKALEELGARHVSYGTLECHYDVVGHALMEMLAEVLGEDLNPPTRQAWLQFYHLISTAMIEGSRKGTALSACTPSTEQG